MVFLVAGLIRPAAARTSTLALVARGWGQTVASSSAGCSSRRRRLACTC